jgi:hypothetical protein
MLGTTERLNRVGVTPGSAIRIIPAADINGISCLGVVELATVMPLRSAASESLW